MQENYNNKAIKSEEVKSKVVSPSTQAFHFSGGGKYVPQKVEAGTYKEALEIYEKTRVEVNKN